MVFFAARQHQNGHLLASFSDPMAEGEAIDLGQGQVQQDQVVGIGLQQLPGRSAITGNFHGIGLIAQQCVQGLHH